MSVKSVAKILLIALLFKRLSVQATPGLVLPEERTGLGCIPEGRTVSYECTVTDSFNGGGSTRWEGSAFNCPPSSPRITLSHPDYQSGMSAMASCGGLTAVGVGVNGTEYTSRLTLTATAELNGRMINCSLVGGMLFGSNTIRIGAIPPALSGLLNITSSGSSVSVSWSPPIDSVEGGVGGYMFGVIGEGCGCVSMSISGDTTSVTCSGWTAAGQICSFEVRTLSQDCGFTSEPPHLTKSLVLSAPSRPTDLTVAVSTDSCSFSSASVTASWIVPSMSFSVPNMTSYRVKVSKNEASVLFDQLISDSQATSGVIPGSVFPQAGSFFFSVMTINSITESIATTVLMKIATTDISSSVANTTMISAVLVFTLSNGNCVGAADVVVYYEECANDCECPEDDSISTNRLSAPVAMNPMIVTVGSNLTPGGYYCYRSIVISGGVIVGLENGGQFRTALPEPPLVLNGAILVSLDPPIYVCSNSMEGFNGNSGSAVAVFSSTSGMYSLPSCTILNWIIAMIIISVLLVVIVVVVVIVVIACCVVKNKGTGIDDKEQLRDSKQSPPSLYADPNTIENDTAATGEEYAMVEKKSKKPKPTQPRELYQTKAPNNLNQSGPVYEEPDDIKPDPHTEGNLAYVHVQRKKKQKSSQPPTELKKPIGEDPHTQENVAYGQVQH